MVTSRYLSKFESIDGLVSYTFPLAKYEYSPRQNLRTPEDLITGGHYAYDHRGTAQALKASGQETVRFVLKGPGATMDSDLDTLRQKVLGVGLGKLYTIDAAGTAGRWAYARPLEVPQISIRGDSPNLMPVIASFRRQSDWYGTAQYGSSFPGTAGTITFNVVNDGNARVFNSIFIVKGSVTGSPALTNLTNGYLWTSNRRGTTASSWFKVDAGAGSVGFSTDDGASYANDYANFGRGSLQAQFMVLEPGTNSMQLTGAGSGTISVSFYPAYH